MGHFSTKIIFSFTSEEEDGDVLSVAKLKKLVKLVELVMDSVYCWCGHFFLASQAAFLLAAPILSGSC